MRECMTKYEFLMIKIFTENVNILTLVCSAGYGCLLHNNSCNHEFLMIMIFVENATDTVNCLAKCGCYYYCMIFFEFRCFCTFCLQFQHTPNLWLGHQSSMSNGIGLFLAYSLLSSIKGKARVVVRVPSMS